MPKPGVLSHGGSVSVGKQLVANNKVPKFVNIILKAIRTDSKLIFFLKCEKKG